MSTQTPNCKRKRNSDVSLYWWKVKAYSNENPGGQSGGKFKAREKREVGMETRRKRENRKKEDVGERSMRGKGEEEKNG